MIEKCRKCLLRNTVPIGRSRRRRSHCADNGLPMSRIRGDRAEHECAVAEKEDPMWIHRQRASLRPKR